jgi:hypothetical protein
MCDLWLPTSSFRRVCNADNRWAITRNGAHHYVAERFFGRSKNRRGTKRESIFEVCPWGSERKTQAYCYECHEELLHNPVLLPDDVSVFARLVQARGLAEDHKPENRKKLAGRIILMHDVISTGLRVLLEQVSQQDAT